jgi:DNA-binding MarR family transcriptional regulator
MTRQSRTPDEDALDEQACRVWAEMRDLTENHTARAALRGELNLGRGSGRVKALLWLAEGPLSVSGLAEAVGVDAPYATLIVDTLVERGLVERRPDPDDRRRKLVSLTAAGKEMVARVNRIRREPPAGFANLSAAELSTLEDLLQRITAGSSATASRSLFP